MEQILDRSQVTLGILAGGRASRLGGRDKAWLQRAGVPQVIRLARRFDVECGTVLVSANVGLERYAEQGLSVVSDHVSGVGPIAGLQALANACDTPWLLTLPVDVIGTNECLLRTLAMAGDAGAVAEDDDGLQPLVALYRVELIRAAINAALAAGEHAVQAMQERLDLPRVRFSGLRFGNLNTPEDLIAAGIDDA
ncbi:molybdenum cofactor guanylyltransferase [Thermomonas sp.]|uniref:molybdenum cofactor guanylyltransferase n=1 Tax=Thermomonas sp. TaxID=1971895 RepID=UPI00248A6263|nr:molybdenum cofactor guanylyltransferase [Thermomonas sp.]MDI1253428.1 molybdenum cofactor guanylyltransferase [Thermomonas sp.]